jgi:hypothetical protein
VISIIYPLFEYSRDLDYIQIACFIFSWLNFLISLAESSP